MKIMNFGSIKAKFPFVRNPKSLGSKNSAQTKFRIDETPDVDYETVKVSKVGLFSPFAIEGVVILTSDEGKDFPITAFSGEVAGYISNFLEQNRNAVPTVYNMFEQICEENEVTLVKVKVYESGNSLRANLYFTGKRDMVLRNYRASDAIALATFYNIPILLRKNLLEKKVSM